MRRLISWNGLGRAAVGLLLISPLMLHGALLLPSGAGRLKGAVCERQGYATLTQRLAFAVCGGTSEGEDDDEDAATPPPRHLAAARLVVDSPALGQAVSGTVRVSGWAADPEATDGTGVDEIAIYLVAPGGKALTLLGSAKLGQPRPDLALALGDERFALAGFTFDWDTSTLMQPGEWQALTIAVREGDDWTSALVSVKIRPAAATATRASPPAPSETPAASLTVGGVRFSTIETERATIFYRDRVTAEQLRIIVLAIDRAAEQAPQLMGLLRPAGRIPVYVFPDSASFGHDSSAMLGSGAASTAGGFYREVDAPLGGIYLDAGAFREPGMLAGAVTHEYVHHVVGSAVGRNTPGLWFNEGIADYVAYLVVRPMYPDQCERDHRDVVATVVAAQAKGKLPALRNLDSYNAIYTRDFHLAGDTHLIYAEGTLAVEQLANRHGLAAVAGVARSMGEGLSWREAFTRMHGTAPAAFGDEFAAELPALATGVTPVRARPGELVSVITAGFQPREPYHLELLRPDGVTMQLNDGLTDEGGLLTLALRTAPSSPAGTWTLFAHGYRGSTASLSFDLAATAAP